MRGEAGAPYTEPLLSTCHFFSCLGETTTATHWLSIPCLASAILALARGSAISYCRLHHDAMACLACALTPRDTLVSRGRWAIAYATQSLFTEHHECAYSTPERKLTDTIIKKWLCAYGCSRPGSVAFAEKDTLACHVVARVRSVE